ncbi:MAG: hypothetical protein AB2540_08190 [Candidatus Thiodiazotropha endolucinida]|uniref:Uncharacterized protein n=2 Tax=Candidatus Thiodiazotropha TaxID=1913444 RepID=A0A7Z0VPH1_9GAMM|nr:hypothetical protein [Candidatus Thiodiazotropha endolucinida]MBT3010845.1 hypothetical protein [Candidatus Thiodiazotropha sp. (ex Lucina pensylvanica)]MBT3015172.1 hypothetical protein [Candidatus Thiodiazotropha taylori]MBT3037674.1 hypothetical protein [Candidatus Thiodiazotropha sp. (ex Codakia orbicularis)]MBV2101528.1 hypothetical protein [Candidatus Thiodiazotropha sp. (ex Lucina aurantia)]MBW9264191.1 hypothetical protein [Candidatus Thiodiazotropha sp. (ex. Lucinisca nassula)]PUB
MKEKYMVLPSARFDEIRLVKVPKDLDTNEAYRFATGIIAQAEETNRDYRWEDIAEALEARGFEPIEAMIGPALD